ncbi:MAG: stage II sporulation protein P [Caloramator sp.]|nr:stage II sporulation protein P [Caloramator sp.]
MHKRLNWISILESLGKIGVFLVVIKTLLSHILPIMLIFFNSKYKINTYQFLLVQATPMLSIYQEEDEEDINWFSIITKNLTGIDFLDYKTLLISGIPIMGEVEQQILAIKENGPVIVIPRSETTLEKDEEEIQGEEIINNSSQQKEETTINIVEEAKSDPPKKRKLDPKKPLILIYHTHTTESFNPDGRGENFTTDSNLNLIKVGQELKRELEEKYGVSTIHDTTFHDIPKREGAYLKSRPTVQRYLKKYDSFKIIIDLHRDANVGKNKATAIIGNERYGRVMFVVDTLNKNHTRNNILASKINDKFNYLYPGFSRGIMYKQSKSHYNQDLSSKIVLIEVGSNENSIEEALNSVKIIARVLAECIE